MIELCHLDVRHFLIKERECSHLLNGCTTKCGCIGLILYRYLSRLGAIICDINTIEFVSVHACRMCNALVASCATVH